MTSSTIANLERFGGVRSMAPFPIAATRLLSLIGVEASPQELAAVIETDPALTAAVLKLANSPRYVGVVPFRSVREAAKRIGRNEIFKLATQVCARSYFQSDATMGGDLATYLWFSSLVQAVTTEYAAEGMSSEIVTALYTAGLLSEIGRTLIFRSSPDHLNRLYGAVLDGANILEAERRLFGDDHATIGAAILESWGFPDLILDAARHHHSRPKDDDGDRVIDDLAREGADAAAWVILATSQFDAFHWLVHRPAGAPPSTERFETIQSRLKDTADLLDG